MKFELHSKFKPTGDQPQAIKSLVNGIKKGHQFQTLLGVTGSGKTFTMSAVVEKIQKPTLVISPNKTLAAQLYEEFKYFFPKNEVCYFVSYYDYYQPEAYIPQRDVYIEKDAKINEEIDRLRHQAVQALSTRKDVLIVASVSCIYNLGSPESYQSLCLKIKKEQKMTREQLISHLLDLQYERNDYNLWRGKMRQRAQFIDIWSSGEDRIIRVEIDKDTIISIQTGEVPFGKFKPIASIDIWPAKFWLSERNKINIAAANIELELQEQYLKLKQQKKIIEAERLKRRTEYDLAMLRESGWCSGIENYSRHLEFRKPNTSPFTLLDYFPKDYLIFIDESHISIPQIRGMYEGDSARKSVLINYGFRLPSALDNRPLKFDEFLKKTNQVIFASATPAKFEKQVSENVAEQIIRPTYLLDPVIEIRSTKNQIQDLLKEINEKKELDQRVLVLTLTKRLAEAISEHLKEQKIKASYLHSEIKTLVRPKVLANLRKGFYDAIVGINLLREGLDLPEVSLITILDADKEGFLRDETSLIQIMGRASRHPQGKVIMYGDKITSSMKKAIEETDRRRKIQEEYNRKNRVKPKPVIKEIRDSLSLLSLNKEEEQIPEKEFLKDYLKQLKYKLDLARRNLQYEKAAEIKEKIDELKENT
ncbi:MAG: excinuclease ABC subunit UvrB [Candidatus Pacebacteria bacterium]|nr:excinuclease ABC subunit UvrB [Candidatus Paceibacterota bacterium]